MSVFSFAQLLAQAAADTTAVPATTDPSSATAPAGPPAWTTWAMFLPMLAAVYFALIRPQQQATKKKEETLKAARTGDRIVTTSGIHGVITNVKDTTVIVKVAENVKLEIEKTHIDRITRPDTDKTEKPADKATAKA
jgi:preprotein translocase subunit YajC